jgi:hypothetical protein
MKTGINTVRAAARSAEGKVALAAVGAVLVAATIAQATKSIGRSRARKAESSVQ